MNQTDQQEPLPISAKEEGIDLRKDPPVARLVQIAVNQDELYALDEFGRLWRNADDSGWSELTRPAGATGRKGRDASNPGSRA